jgi:type II secretory pathway predicted ATPase ExeA
MNDNVIIHYGIPGMKWGIRKTPEELGRDILRKSKVLNFDKWGKDKNNNILYVTGYSGSGKSTISRHLADKNTNVIHLDEFFEPDDPKNSPKDREFVKYLSKNFPDYKKITMPKNKISIDKWVKLLINFKII